MQRLHAENEVSSFKNVNKIKLLNSSMMHKNWFLQWIDILELFTGCGASSGAELHGVEAEPWVFKGGLSGEVQVGMI